MDREKFEIPESLNRASVYSALDHKGKCKRVGKTTNPLAIESKKIVGYRHVYYPVPDDKDIIDYLNELIIEFKPELNTRLFDCYTLNQAYYYLSQNGIKDTGKVFIDNYSDILGYQMYNYKNKIWIRKNLIQEIIFCHDDSTIFNKIDK